jgi:hypothetical protein
MGDGIKSIMSGWATERSVCMLVKNTNMGKGLKAYAYYKTDNYDAGNKSLGITLTSEVLSAGANVILNPVGRAAGQSAITIGSEIAEDKLIKRK